MNGHTPSNWHNRNDKDLTSWKQVKRVWNEHETTDNTHWTNMTVTSRMPLQVTDIWQACLWYSPPLNWLTSLSTNSLGIKQCRMRLTLALSKCFQPISTLWYLFHLPRTFISLFLIYWCFVSFNQTLFYFLHNEILHPDRRSCCCIVIGVFLIRIRFKFMTWIT